MKYILILLLLIPFTTSFAQLKIYTLIDAKSNEPIKNALIYDDNLLLFKSNNNGQFEIDLTSKKKFTIVKENYIDTEVLTLNNSLIIRLNQIDAILLKEIVIKKMNISALIDSIKSNFTINCNKYIKPKSLHYYNLFLKNIDTLHYVNNRISYREEDGFYIDNQNKFLKNYNVDVNLQVIYNFNNMKMSFWKSFITPGNSFCQLISLNAIFDNLKDYHFNLLSGSDIYKLEIINLKQGKDSYNGYIIVDPYDYGIYELSLRLVNSKNNIKNSYIFIDKTNQKYLINTAKYFVQYQKSNGIYSLKTYSEESNFTQLNGNFKSSNFKNLSTIEETIQFQNTKLTKFNFIF